MNPEDFNKQQNRLFNVAVQMAPAFRDKFDYSDAKNFTDLAEVSFKAALALIVHDDKLRAEWTAEQERKAREATK